MSLPGSTPPFEVSHVFFDVDGTLVDFVGAMWTALASVGERASQLTGTPITRDVLQSARGQVAVDPEWRDASFRQTRVESFRRVLAQGAAAGEDAVDELMHIYVEVRVAEMRAYPDVEGTLRALRSRGYALVAASNGNVDLAPLGLAEYFVGTHYAEHVGVAKPDSRFFTTAAADMGVRVEDGLVVGDRLDNDYHPAREAGMSAVLIDRRGRVSDPSIVRIGSLEELPDLLGSRR